MYTPVARRSFLKSLGAAGAGAALSYAGSGQLLAKAMTSSDPLSYRDPESQGVRSAAILDFLEGVERAGIELHSFNLVRHGHLLAAGWWAPYRPSAVHLLYSLSKIFTSTAVGFAVAEGRLKLTDKVVDFFPDKRPRDVDANLAALNVQHLLTMSVGHATDSTPIITKEEDWTRAFLSLPIAHPPGSVFLYDSGSPYMLSAIVQKLTGQTLLSYLTPRLFEPLGVEGMTWETCPLGINTGGWGLSVTTPTIARLGQLYLEQGRWQGKRRLSPEWVADATALHIRQPAEWAYSVTQSGKAGAPQGAALEAELRRTNDWYQGYGYQFWRCRHGAYRGDGAFGQLCVVMPGQDAVLAVTSSTANIQGLLDAIWERLLPAMKRGTLPVDPRAGAALRGRLASLKLPLPQGSARATGDERIDGRVFQLEPNALGASRVGFKLSSGQCRVRLTLAAHEIDLTCGFGDWIDGAIDHAGFAPEIAALGRTVKPKRPLQVAAAGAWKPDGSLELQWRYYETPHREVVTCRFAGDRVEMSFLNDLIQRPVLQGRRVL